MVRERLLDGLDTMLTQNQKEGRTVADRSAVFPSVLASDQACWRVQHMLSSYMCRMMVSSGRAGPVTTGMADLRPDADRNWSHLVKILR